MDQDVKPDVELAKFAAIQLWESVCEHLGAGVGSGVLLFAVGLCAREMASVGAFEACDQYAKALANAVDIAKKEALERMHAGAH